MPETTGYLGAVYVTASPSVTLTNFALANPSLDGMTWVTPSSQYAKRYWDKTTSWTIQTSTNGGTSWTTITSGYSIQYVGGIVTLTVALTGTPAVQVSGAYFAYSQVLDAHQWEMAWDSDVVDVTPFNQSGWKAQMELIRGATVKFSRYWADSTYIGMLGNLMVVVCFITNASGPATGQRFEGYAYLKQDPIKSDMKAVLTEDLDFIVDGQWYYVAN